MNVKEVNALNIAQKRSQNNVLRICIVEWPVSLQYPYCRCSHSSKYKWNKAEMLTQNLSNKLAIFSVCLQLLILIRKQDYSSQMKLGYHLYVWLEICHLQSMISTKFSALSNAIFFYKMFAITVTPLQMFCSNLNALNG